MVEAWILTKQVKHSNRDKFPYAAGILDELRGIFGEGVRIVYAEEKGETVGNKGPDGVRPNIERRNKDN